MTTNPSRGHLMDDFYTPWSAGKLKDHRMFIQALPQDNPYLPKAYIDNLKNTLSDAEYRTLVLGHWEWSANSDCLVSYNDCSKMFGYSAPDNLTGNWYLSVDVAFSSDRCVMVLWNGNDVMDIIDLPKSVKPEDRIKELIAKYNIPEKHVVIDVVGAGLYLKLATYISEGSIRIHDEEFESEVITECMQLIKLPAELIGGKIKMISKKQIKQNIGHSPDFLDALSMKMVFDIKPGYKISF